MKCLRKYKWVKLPRMYLPAGKGLMGYWAKLASRAAFRKGNAVYCGHTNPVTPGMWSGGVVGLKSILGVKKRAQALCIMEQLQELGYINYTLDQKTKHLIYQVKDWVVKCSGAECKHGAVYATQGYGFLCIPRDITERLVGNRKLEEADAWLDLWCHTTYGDYGNAFSFLAPAIQYGKYGSALTLDGLGKRWGWEKTKVWRFFKKFENAFTLFRLPGSYGCLIFNRHYPDGSEVQMPTQEDVSKVLNDIREAGKKVRVRGSDCERLNCMIAWKSGAVMTAYEKELEDESKLGIAVSLPIIRAYFSHGRNCKICRNCSYDCQGRIKGLRQIFQQGHDIRGPCDPEWPYVVSSMGQFIGNGGALTTGKGSIFLWMFCALAYLKCAQRFDSYLGSIGLNVAQTGSSMGMELLMAARVITGAGGAAKSAGSVFSKGGATPTGTGAAATGFAAGFASKFNPNSYVRDSVVDGGTRMGFGGGAGFVARAFGGMAARNGATLNSQSVSSVASRSPNASGTIAGDIADRSLGNYMPHMKGFQLKGTQITGGHISTTATTADGKTANVDMYSASQYEKPDAPHSVVTAADGSQWYQMASGEGRGAFYDAPTFGGRTGQQNAGGVDPNQDASHTDTGAQVPGTQTETAGAAVQDGSEMGGAGMPQGMDSSSTDQTGVVPDQSGTILPDGSEPAGAEVPADQRDISDTPATEEMQPVGGGIPQGADGIQDEQKHDPAVQSGDLQTESMVPGAQIPSAEKEAGGSGIVAQQTEEREQSISVPSSEQGSMASTTSEADAQFHEAAPVSFGADPHSDEVDAAVGETTAQMPSGDGVIPEQTDSGIASAPIAGQLHSDDLQGAGESVVPFGEHDSAVPAEQSLDEPQTGSVVNIPGVDAADNGGLLTQEGGLDAGQTEGAVVPAADTHAEMPAFTGDPIGTSDAIVAGEVGLEGEREMPVHAPGLTGPDASDAAVQNESGDASVQTETAETHTAGTDIPQFGAGMVDGIHDADHDAASDSDSFHTGHEDQHSSGHSNAAGFSGGSSFGGYAEAPLVAATFPDAEEGTMLRTVGEGMIEASSPDGGNTLWYNSAFYQEPDAPHSVMEAANGVQWYAMQQQAQAPEFESGAEAAPYNQAAFRSFMPGYDGQVSQVDGSHRQDGHFEVRNAYRAVPCSTIPPDMQLPVVTIRSLVIMQIELQPTLMMTQEI